MSPFVFRDQRVLESLELIPGGVHETGYASVCEALWHNGTLRSSRTSCAKHSPCLGNCLARRYLLLSPRFSGVRTVDRLSHRPKAAQAPKKNNVPLAGLYWPGTAQGATPTRLVATRYPYVLGKERLVPPSEGGWSRLAPRMAFSALNNPAGLPPDGHPETLFTGYIIAYPTKLVKPPYFVA